MQLLAQIRHLSIGRPANQEIDVPIIPPRSGGPQPMGEKSFAIIKEKVFPNPIEAPMFKKRTVSATRAPPKNARKYVRGAGRRPP